MHRLSFKLARILNVRERKPFTFCFKQSLGIAVPGQLRGALQRAMTAQGHDMMTFDQAETLRTIQSTLAELAAQVSHLFSRLRNARRGGRARRILSGRGRGPNAAIEPAAAIEPIVAGDDFARIKGIDAVARSLLGDLSITRYADLAAFTADDVQEVGRLLHDAKRISREGWIEQAAVLMAGRETAYSKRAAFETAVVAHVCGDEGEPYGFDGGSRRRFRAGHVGDTVNRRECAARCSNSGAGCQRGRVGGHRSSAAGHSRGDRPIVATAACSSEQTPRIVGQCDGNCRSLHRYSRCRRRHLSQPEHDRRLQLQDVQVHHQRRRARLNGSK